MALSKSFYLYLGSIDGLTCTEHSPCISGDCIETEDGISCMNCSPGKKNKYICWCVIYIEVHHFFARGGRLDGV